MTTNAYGRLSVGNTNAGQTGYSGVYGGHASHTHNTHSNHTGGGTHNTNNEVSFPNTVAPEDYLGK